MQSRSELVLDAIASVAAATDQQSRAAEEVSTSAVELAAQFDRISDMTENVRTEAFGLQRIVATFDLETDGPASLRALVNA